MRANHRLCIAYSLHPKGVKEEKKKKKEKGGLLYNYYYRKGLKNSNS
jgi:hypothetical protein